MIGTKELRKGSTSKRPVWFALGAVGAGVLGFRVLRKRMAGSAREMFDQERAFGSPVDSEGVEAAPPEERMTANERSDGVRRTGDDRLVRPMAAGETDPVAAADPTVAPAGQPGRPTGVDSPTPDS